MSKAPTSKALKPQRFLTSGILYRPGHGAKPIMLGAMIEFTRRATWVVGLVVRHIIDPASLAGLSQLSRDLIDARQTILQAELDDALAAARRPGDVLRILAARNEWSFNVTPPREMSVKATAADAAKTQDQLAEEYAILAYRRALVPAQPATQTHHVQRNEAAEEATDLGPEPPPETPPAWMLRPQVYRVPLDGRR